MDTARNNRRFNWQQEGWPAATVDRTALRGELAAFKKAFRAVKKRLKKPQPAEAVAHVLAQEAVKTSAIEGVMVDESVVLSSICKALGVASAPAGFTKDPRAEGVAQMMLAVREDWDKPLTAAVLKRWHKKLLAGEEKRVAVGAFRSHKEPMRVIRRLADGSVEIRFEAPPSVRVPQEIRVFLAKWRKLPASEPADVALKCALTHPHFESIHPFEDGNGRVGRALMAKILAEGLGLPLVLPVSTIIARHRAAYYDEINAASRSLDWTSWTAFCISVLTETLTSFLAAVDFVAAKRRYLTAFWDRLSPRARIVLLRMFEDGREGVASGLSVAKWRRMTKVSKATATRDLAELAATGAIVADWGKGPKTHYALTCQIREPISFKNAKMREYGKTEKVDSSQQNQGSCERRADFGHEPISENEPLNEPLNETINETIEEHVLRLVTAHPGRGVPFLKATTQTSRETVKRALAALVAAGKVEHRGSKKTGGYYALSASAVEVGTR
jgi:Fic family protein